MEEINQLNGNGKEDGYWKVYYRDNGALWHCGNYINGVKAGYWEIYYADKTLAFKGNYVNDKMEGLWIYTDRNDMYFYATD